MHGAPSRYPHAGTADREKSVYMKKLELVKNRGKEIGRQFGIVKALDLVALQPLLFALA